MSVSFISAMHLESCTFTRNEGISLLAGAIDGGKINITNCHIAENNSPHEIRGTFMVGGSPKSLIHFINCTFVKNYANDGGAVFNWSPATLHFKKCIFMENKAFTAGVFDTGTGRGHFENCKFIANEGILHTGAIMGQSGAHLVIHNSLFKDNIGINAVGAVAVKLQSELTVVNCTFINNTSENRAGAILVEENAIGSISESTFINNSAVHHGCINVNSNVTLQINSTHFVGNIANVAAVIFSEYNVRVEIFLSTFERNEGENTVEVRDNSSFTVMNSKFYDNDVASGSVIFVYLNSNIAVENSTFLNHSTTLHGAVIYGSQSSNINLKESNLHHNHANKGGVIYIVHCTLQIANTILNFNKATDGGVIYTTFSIVNISNSSCMYNFVNGYGGCLHVATSNVSLKYSNMSHNQAFEGGSVMIFSNSDFSALKTNFYKQYSCYKWWSYLTTTKWIHCIRSMCIC